MEQGKPDVSPEKGIYRSITEATTAFLEHCESEGLKFSTYRKYRNTLTKLREFCEKRDIDWVNKLDINVLDKFRAGRGLKPITSSKELQVLRQFCGFCTDHNWMESNTAKRIKGPRNIKPNDVEPFTSIEVGQIIGACGLIGTSAYATELLGRGATFEEIADILGSNPDIVRKHYAKWSVARQTRIDELMEGVHSDASYITQDVATTRVQ